MKIITLVIITLLLQSCTIYGPFEGVISEFIDDMYEKHGPDPIMSGYELMERSYRTNNKWRY